MNYLVISSVCSSGTEQEFAAFIEKMASASWKKKIVYVPFTLNLIAKT